MTNPCVMPFVYLVMSSLLKLRIKLPKRIARLGDRGVAQRADLVNSS